MRDTRSFRCNGIRYVWNGRGNRVSPRTRDRRVGLERAAAVTGCQGRRPGLWAAIDRFRRENGVPIAARDDRPPMRAGVVS